MISTFSLNGHGGPYFLTTVVTRFFAETPEDAGHPRTAQTNVFVLPLLLLPLVINDSWGIPNALPLKLIHCELAEIRVAKIEPTVAYQGLPWCEISTPESGSSSFAVVTTRNTKH